MERADEVGRRLRQIRHARGKSLTVVAGLAGISKGYLSKLEHGQYSLDRRSLIVRLAEALEVAPTELSSLAAASPGEVAEDQALGDVRVALLSIGMGQPGGDPAALGGVSGRVAAVLDDQQHCRHAEVGAALPGLLRDLHSAIAAGRDDRDLIRLSVLLHVQGVQAWLRDVGGPLDLGWQAAIFAQQAADRLDEPISTGVAGFGSVHGLLAAGAFDLAAGQLQQAYGRVSTATAEGLQLSGILAFTSAMLTAARQGDVTAPLEAAEDIARRTGEGNALWFGFGPTNVGVWRMAVALESGEHPAAADIAEQVNPELIPSPQRRAAYWTDYGRALAQLRGRRADAVAALRRAELISPTRLRRHPFARATLAELLSRSPRDAAGRELRGMAYRAGLHV